jgi:hypothetical protein
MVFLFLVCPDFARMDTPGLGEKRLFPAVFVGLGGHCLPGKKIAHQNGLSY